MSKQIYERPVVFKDFVTLRRNTAPADVAVGAGEAALWFDPTNGSAALMLKGKSLDGTVVTATLGGGGGGGTPAGADTQIQFNNAGAFGADINFSWSNGLIIGQDLPPVDLPDIVGLSVFTGGNAGLAINAIASGSAPVALSANAIAATDQSSANAIITNVSAKAGATLTNGAHIQVASFNNGGTIVNQYGLQVLDLTNATNNWAIKTGAGMVEIGDATKAAGIIVKGLGMAVPGPIGSALLVLEADNNHPYGFVISNSTAGAALSTAMYVDNDGTFWLTGALEGNISYNPASTGQAYWGFDKPVKFADWMSTSRVTAPADGDIAAGELAFWLDDTNGATKAMFKAKSANGTVVTGNVALA